MAEADGPSRLVLLLNELEEGNHDDVRRSIQFLLDDGTLASAEIIAFPALLKAGRSVDDVNQATIDAARRTAATIVMWVHVGEFPVRPSTVRELRRLDSSPALGHWEGDAYHSWFKPLPRVQLTFLPQCDCIFVPGRLAVLPKLRRRGCHDIRYVPSLTDVGRFGGPLPRPYPKEFDVVMIGNRVSSRRPLGTMPGARQRVHLVRSFGRQFGSRFAVFGDGWSGRSAHGSVPYIDQTHTLARARVVLGNASIDAPLAFSDRLPIAMSSGVPVIHSAVEDSRLLFGQDAPVRFFSSTSDALEAAKDLLARSQRERDEIGLRARDFALEKLTILRGLEYMIHTLESKRGAQERERTSTPVMNPWLPFDSF